MVLKEFVVQQLLVEVFGQHKLVAGSGLELQEVDNTAVEGSNILVVVVPDLELVEVAQKVMSYMNTRHSFYFLSFVI